MQVGAVGSNFEKGTTQGPSLQRLVHFCLDVSEKIFKCFLAKLAQFANFEEKNPNVLTMLFINKDLLF
jgi:hypothetical protein